MKRKKEKRLAQPDEIQKLLWLRKEKFNDLVDSILLTMDNADKKTKKWILRSVLAPILKDYSSVAQITEKMKSKEILHWFSQPELQKTGEVSQKTSEILEFLSDSKNQVKIESFMSPIVSRLLCMYCTLALSDKHGITLCSNLGKELIKWDKSTPMKVTLAIFEKRQRMYENPFNGCSYLGRYSF